LQNKVSKYQYWIVKTYKGPAKWRDFLFDNFYGKRVFV